MSQIGYMFVGAGIGAYSNGMFHLMTHAFFKALLFLAAGVLIHALAGEQDIRKLGGAGTLAPFTRLVFLAGVARARRHPAVRRLLLEGPDPRRGARRRLGRLPLFALGLVGTFLTGLYTFRLFFIVFRGEPTPLGARALPPPRRHGRGRSRCSASSACSACCPSIGGWIQFSPSGRRSRTGSSRSRAPLVEPSGTQELVASVLAVGARPRRHRPSPGRCTRRGGCAVPALPELRRALEHKLWFDELYDAVFYRPAVALARGLDAVVERPLIAGSLTALGVRRPRSLGGHVAGADGARPLVRARARERARDHGRRLRVGPVTP